MDTNIERTLIGERVFTVKEQGIAFSVRFYKPVQDSVGDYRCEYEFLGQWEEYSGYTAGIDAIDALDNALWMVGTKLAGLNDTKYGGKLIWEGAEPNKPIGLPVIDVGKEFFKDY